MYPTGPKVWVRNLASNQGVRKKPEKFTKGNGENSADYNMEIQETSIMD